MSRVRRDGRYDPHNPTNDADLPLFSGAQKPAPVADEQPRARATDPPTSHEAARKARPAARKLRGDVLAVLDGRGAQGATTEEIANELCAADPDAAWRLMQGLSPRMVELERAGAITRTGVTRRGASGRARIVWRAIPQQGFTNTSDEPEPVTVGGAPPGCTAHPSLPNPEESE